MKAPLAALLLTVGLALAGPIVREPGAIYLSDFDLKMPRFPLLDAAPCFFNTDMKRSAGTLRFPQKVELLAVSNEGTFRVRGNARQGGVAAWIAPQFLGEIPEGFVDKLRAAEKRRREVEELIARNDVAIGMTLAEVERSLGRPQKRSSTTNREGSSQTFEYIRYKLVPQTLYTPAYAERMFGVRLAPGASLQTVVIRGEAGLAASTIYVKVPIGSVTVSFRNGIAESIEESEGTLVGARASIVVPPINGLW